METMEINRRVSKHISAHYGAFCIMEHCTYVPWSIVFMYSFCTIHIKQLRSTHLQPPCLKLIVQYLEVSSCAGVHAALNLCLSVFVGSCLGFGLL